MTEIELHGCAIEDDSEPIEFDDDADMYDPPENDK